MHIMLLLSSLHAGGAERVACTLANAWVERGHQVVLMPTFSGRGDCFYTLDPAVRLVYLADRVSGSGRTIVGQWKRLRALRRFMADECPDVVVSFLTNVNVAAVVAVAGMGIPLVISERVDPFAFRLPRPLQLARRLCYPFASMLVIQTQAVAQQCIERWHASRSMVIPNPIPRQVLAVQRQAHTGPDRRLLAVGRLDEQKQFNVLIRIFATLAGRHPDWSLRIVGEGALRHSLLAQIAGLSLTDRITLTGQVSDIGEELSRADIFASTSRFEGFPNALLEAMAAGLPCVTFDCPSGPREISHDGQVARLVPLNDENGMAAVLDHLMSDADARQHLGEQAHASVLKRFSTETVLARWDALFRTLNLNPLNPG